jgi:hypothetical protein
MVKTSEPLINVVNENKPKVLSVPERSHRLGPKGTGSGIGAPNSPIADGASPAKRRNLTHQNQVLTRNVVSPESSLWESKPQGVPMGLRVREGGKSEGQAVMAWIGVAV